MRLAKHTVEVDLLRTGEITKSLLQAQMVQQTACVGCTLLSHLMPGFVAAIMCPGLHNKRGYIRIRNNLLNDVAGVNTISFPPCELMSQYQVAHVHRLSFSLAKSMLRVSPTIIPH